ncbi:MAG: hypothetical protein BGP11_15480 [Rhodobacterales bacterium 65-51]|uniref:DMT family transporter n=1 Tax=uncultured Gemmobacter sp. TaxID=1095917 RepID=UPI00095B0E1E|nr:DMT family transporter [uncultured Gemmobacter sp.]OJY27461.1 MAG: hypothetical protein BGP11_15480 [Rhodobacterales bacterium 65-51]
MFRIPRPTLLGILCLCSGIAVFSVQDLILKLLSGSYPLHQAMVIRSMTAMPLLFLLVLRDGGVATLVSPGWWRMAARGWLNFAAYTAYYLALAALPIASTVTLFFSAPLMITALSVVMLGARVGPLRWSAVALGFGGVVLMLRPGSALFDWAALLPVVAGLAYAMTMILTRIQGTRFTAPAMAFHGNVVFLFCALALSAVFGSGEMAQSGHASLDFLTRGWVMPPLRDLGLMALCGVIAAAGLTLLTQAYRIAPSSALAPFEYTALIWGVIYGWLVWGDWPDAIGWLGVAVICGAGLIVLWSEAQDQRSAAAPTAA